MSKKTVSLKILTLPVLYEAPMMLEKSNLSWIVCRELSINAGPCDMAEWTEMLKRVACRRRKVTIGLVGKYVKLHDAYLSVAEALRHGGYENDAKVEIKWIEAEELTEGSADSLLGDGRHPGSWWFLATGASRERFWQQILPENTTFHTWESAWACRRRSSNLREMQLALKMPIRESLYRMVEIGSLI